MISVSVQIASKNAIYWQRLSRALVICNICLEIVTGDMNTPNTVLRHAAHDYISYILIQLQIQK